MAIVMQKDIIELKRSQLEQIAQHRRLLYDNPHLHWLFFEITNRCNLNCKHCGSNCTNKGIALRVEDVKATLETIDTDKPMICLTGGEPVLHPQFYEIAKCVHDMGFYWGMTTNATLIDDEAAQKLKSVGMSTVTVSLDGMEEMHDSLRRKNGAWRSAVNGLRALQKAGFAPQVTTVVHKENIEELETLYGFLSDMGITSWRPINVEPIGRACEHGNILLSPEQIRYLFDFIHEKRFDQNCKMEVTFGCSHYLGINYERMIRDHYFLCGAGTLIASVRCNGDICGCLDVINNPELVQGNIKTDNFMEVWNTRFGVFRRDRTSDSNKCRNCSERTICCGDSAHTWDYENNEPLLCYQDFGLDE
jgi:radical SAM protein with 4Fe4S-binding SPASM domain